MYKRLIKDASLYSISSLLARGSSLITVPIFTRLLSPADYGALDLLSYMAVLVPLFMGAALDQAIARFYIDASGEMEKKRIASSALFYNMAIFALLIPIALPLSSELAHSWLNDQVDSATVFLVFIYIWINSVFYIVNNQLKYLFLSKQSALCSIGNTVLSVVLSFYFVVYVKWGVYGIFLGQVLGQSFFALISIYYARESYALVFSWTSLKRMMVYSLPLVPGTVAFYLMQYVDRYAINQINGLADVGIYGIGARIASLSSLFLVGFSSAWSPIFMKSYREQGATQKFSVVFNYYLFAVSSILVGLSLFGREILLLLTTKAFSQGYIVVPLMLLAAILASIGQYFTYGIQIAQKSNYRMLLNLAALGVNVVLNYLLIPSMGIIGASLATVISLTFMTVIGMMISQRLYFVPYQWPRIFMAATLVIVISNSVVFANYEVSIQFILIKVLVTLMVIYVLARLLHVSLDPKMIASSFRNTQD